MIFFLWVDLEMTGLNVDSDYILEIACICTDKNFDRLFDYHAVIFQPRHIIDAMQKFCYEMHQSSGLIDKVLQSTVSCKQVEEELIILLAQYTSINNVYIAGNSVYNDLIFIKKYMPKIASWMHYRTFDVSTLKLIAQIQNLPPFIKQKKHTALADIQESLKEFGHYQRNLFIQKNKIS